MSPPGKTSLCAEIPCAPDGKLWQTNDTELFRRISSHFLELGWMRIEEILDFKVIRMQHAYPVLEKGYEKRVQDVIDFVKGFANLNLSGRNGRYVYSHMHDMMRCGRDAVEHCMHAGGTGHK